MSDYNLKVTVRNARLLSLIEGGFGTQVAFARAFSLNAGRVNALVTFREAPFGDAGWTPFAEDVAAALGVYPSDIWPEHLARVRRSTSTATFTLTHEDVQAIASEEDPIERAGSAALIETLKEALNDRELDVVQRVEVNNETLEDVAQDWGVSRGRISQIRYRALRKMQDRAVKIGAAKREGRYGPAELIG